MTGLSPRSRAPQVAEPLVPPTNPDRRDTQRSYVFVDEQNRHKRLKVVRACDGCRRRKIKCDAANTNRWPCSACVRLRLHCIPPSLGFDGEDALEQDHGPPTRYTPEDYVDAGQYNYDTVYAQSFPSFVPMAGPSHGIPYQSPHHAPPLPGSGLISPGLTAPRYNHVDVGFMGDLTPQASRGPPNYTLAPPLSAEEATLGGDSDQLASALVNLNLNDAVGNDAVAKYIINPLKQGTATPASNDDEYPLPPHVVQSSHIPPDWMPSDSLAGQYFSYFFENLHPYVPVISASHLYHMWNTNKHSINPILLEAIFACSALGLQHIEEGNKWLALAAKHEDRYKDSPRLSTIQGMLILLKAREAVPKKGYYYRSWMTIVNLVAMAKDLELDEHLEIHESGEECGATSPEECATKTRVWHVLFAIELIVGGPQGRTTYGVKIDTVDFTNLSSLVGIEDKELKISQHFVHFLQAVRNIRTSNLLYATLKKRKTDWAADPEFVRHNQDFDEWLALLPTHLHINYPPAGALPFIRSHFVANLHAYHNLSILVQYRPQLELAYRTVGGQWKPFMMQCLAGAKNICRLQEGILNFFGLAGFFHMLRGINFHIYAILTSINIHLVALTSPDPDVNYDATEYFTRHMRILENCSSSWPMPELQQQIQSLRQAFSADLNKPFELRPSYIYGSPRRSESLSPDQKSAYPSHDHDPLTGAYGTFPLTPAATVDSSGRADYGSSQPTLILQSQYNGSSQGLPSAQRAPEWNPVRIFDNWNIAFGAPQSTQTAQTPTSQTATSPAQPFSSQQLQDNSYGTYTQPVTNMPEYVAQMQPQQQQLPTAPAYVAPQHAYISPNMWREALAHASSSGARRKVHGSTAGLNIISKRR